VGFGPHQNVPLVLCTRDGLGDTGAMDPRQDSRKRRPPAHADGQLPSESLRVGIDVSREAIPVVLAALRRKQEVVLDWLGSRHGGNIHEPLRAINADPYLHLADEDEPGAPIAVVTNVGFRELVPALRQPPDRVANIVGGELAKEVADAALKHATSVWRRQIPNALF
jgi:hypothetical protein